MPMVNWLQDVLNWVKTVNVNSASSDSTWRFKMFFCIFWQVRTGEQELVQLRSLSSRLYSTLRQLHNGRGELCVLFGGFCF